MVDVRRLAAFPGDPAGGDLAGGNPAGVLVAENLPGEAQMQAIAAEVGYSETAFLAPTGGRTYRVRYFSPLAEVDFCGHATIAAGVELGRRRGPGTYVVTTNSGAVAVDVVETDGAMWATLTSVATQQRAVPAGVLDAFLETFGWTTTDLEPALPALDAFAGGWHLVLGPASRQRFEDMAYRFEDLRSLMLDRGLTTVQVVFRESEDRWLSRNPFPVGGVVEDPATGAAAAAFGGYLRDTGVLRTPARLTIRQGEQVGRPSLLRVEVPETGGIRVTGTAVEIPAQG